jgi:hypothetical protein
MFAFTILLDVRTYQDIKGYSPSCRQLCLVYFHNGPSEFSRFMRSENGTIVQFKACSVFEVLIRIITGNELKLAQFDLRFVPQ